MPDRALLVTGMTGLRANRSFPQDKPGLVRVTRRLQPSCAAQGIKKPGPCNATADFAGESARDRSSVFTLHAFPAKRYPAVPRVASPPGLPGRCAGLAVAGSGRDQPTG
ncbi:hypothetical protein CRM88_13965, partial [Lactococcus lactis]